MKQHFLLRVATIVVMEGAKSVFKDLQYDIFLLSSDTHR